MNKRLKCWGNGQDKGMDGGWNEAECLWKGSSKYLGAGSTL